MQLNLKQILREVKSYTVIALGMFTYSFAWVGIITPAKIMGGGITGLSLLIFYATGGEEGGGIPIGYTYVVLNLTILGIGALVLGWIFGVKTIFSMIAVSVSLTLGQEYLPYDILGIANDKLLSAVLGGILCGLGISRAIIEGGSTGGTDIVAMIIRKYKSVGFGTVIMTCDILIVGSSYFIYQDITTIIYGYITILALGYSADMAILGRTKTCQLMITTKKYAEVADAIMTTGRGATLLSAQGWYTKEEQKIVMLYCRLSEAKTFQYMAKDIDPDAFISTSTVNGVLGKGFDALLEKKKK